MAPIPGFGVLQVSHVTILGPADGGFGRLILPLTAMLFLFNWTERIHLGRRQLISGGSIFWFGVLGAIGAVGLLAKWAFDPRMRGFTSPAAVFNVVLLLAVFVSGLAAVAATDYFGGVTAFVAALTRADGAAVVPGLVTLHMGLTLVFLAYLPLTKMMHFVAKYFTYHEVRWNDEPMTTGGPMEREVQELLSQPVTWAGPHVHADGKKTWVDIATEEVAK